MDKVPDERLCRFGVDGNKSRRYVTSQSLLVAAERVSRGCLPVSSHPLLLSMDDVDHCFISPSSGYI
jgi:hypothetical protein